MPLTLSANCTSSSDLSAAARTAPATIAPARPKPVVDNSVVALPPGREARLLGLRRAIEAARAHEDTVPALPEGHTIPSGHPVFAAWLRCQAVRTSC